LVASAPYAADEEEMHDIYSSAFDLYMKNQDFPEALLVAQKMNE